MGADSWYFASLLIVVASVVAAAVAVQRLIQAWRSGRITGPKMLILSCAWGGLATVIALVAILVPLPGSLGGKIAVALVAGVFVVVMQVLQFLSYDTARWDGRLRREILGRER